MSNRFNMVTYRPFDEIVDFITSFPHPQEVLAYQPSPTTLQRLEELVEKKQNDQLNEEEAHELEQFLLIEHLMRLAKSRARKRLAA